MAKFKLHWHNGKTEEIKGSDISKAFAAAGYGGGAINALDYYEEIKKKSVKNKPPTKS